MFIWFTQQCSQRILLWRSIITGKAVQINKKYNDEKNFKAIQGWLHRFLRRDKVCDGYKLNGRS